MYLAHFAVSCGFLPFLFLVPLFFPAIFTVLLFSLIFYLSIADSETVIRLSDSEDEGPESEIPEKMRRPNDESDSISLDDDDDQQPSTSTEIPKRPLKTASYSPIGLKETITTFIIEDFQSVEILEDAGFKKLMKYLRPEMILPTSDDITNEILLQYGLERSELLRTLAEVSSISLAIENWTSFSDNTYATVKANFIDDKWQPQSYVLSTIRLNDELDLHTVKIKIAEVTRTWEIEQKIVSIIYDWYPLPASNETISSAAWGPAISDFVLKVQSLVDRKLQSIDNISMLVAKCVRVVAFFLHNNNADIYFHKYQRFLDLPCEPLIQATAGVTNSTYLMLERVLTQRRAIHSALSDTDVADFDEAGDLLISEFDWSMIKQVVSTLKPFQLAEIALHSRYPHVDSVAVVKPMVHTFCTNFLKSNANDLPSIRQMKEELRQDLWSTFSMYDNDHEMNQPDYFDIATFLDPRYKKQDYLSDKYGAIVVNFIGNEYFDDHEKTPAEESTSAQALRVLFPTNHSTGDNELIRYFKEPEIDKDLSPHQWWKLKARRYPTLSLYAKKHLCALSTAKSLLSSRNGGIRRKNLPPHLVDKIIFLNYNTKSSSEALF